MARPGSTFAKLQRDQAKREKAKAKAEDRAARREDQPQEVTEPRPAEDQTALLEQFARLHEDLADGRISIDEFEERQEDLRSRLQVD
jgi:hypothetical protein